MTSLFRSARAAALAVMVWFPLTACISNPLSPEPTVSSSRSVDVADLVTRTNAERLASGRTPLVVSERLMIAAEIQARQMAAARRMSHDLPGSQHPTLGDRARSVGYTYSWIAENIAYGYPSADRLMAGWMNSPGHRDNILSNKVDEIGVAVALAADGSAYYASVFGRAR